MLSEFTETEVLTNPEEDLATPDGVTFDPEEMTLRGLYSDEISAYRAKKIWIETLEASFLLENGHDYKMSISKDEDKFSLYCKFITACARYAFWRITNNQALEAQSMIETAHIPICDSRQDDILKVPDLRSIHDDDAYMRPRRSTTLPDILKDLVEKIRGI